MENNAQKPRFPRQAYRMPVLFLLIPLLAALLSSCITLNDPEVSQEYHANAIGTITSDQTVGQTFVSRRRNFENITIWYSIDPQNAPNDGVLTATLYHTLNDQSPLNTYTIDLNRLTDRVSLTIPFRIRGDSVQQSYYVELSTNNGVIHIYGRDEDAYPGGEFYLGRLPQDSDIGFRLAYYYDLYSLTEDLSTIFDLSYVIVLALLMLWLPGRLLSEHLPIRQNLDWIERLALSIGISMAIIPILLLWTTLFQIPWRREYIIALYLILILVYIWRKRKSIRSFFKVPEINLQTGVWLDLLFCGILLITVITRFAMIRDMAAPAWVDSVHHAMITNLIVDSGAYPQSYSPYIQVENPTYHPGFHSVSAVFQWLTGQEIHTGLLIFGQILNVLSIFSVYLFTKTLTQNRLSALIASGVTGVITPMPAYYTSWGRYTQLAGLLILPAIFVLIVSILDNHDGQTGTYKERFRNRSWWWTMTVSGVTLGGLYLTHYRVTAFLLILVFIFVLLRTVAAVINKRNRTTIRNIPDLLLLGFGSLVITLPWWPESLSNLILPRMAPSTNIVPAFSDFSWFYLTSALGTWAMIAAGLGIVLGLINRKLFSLTILLWIPTLFLVANLDTFNLPGGQFVNNTSVTIMLFLPISAMAGYLVSWIIEGINGWLATPWRVVFNVSIVAVGFMILMLGAQLIIPILNPVTILFREADQQAMYWISDNIPEGETVAINPFNWGYGMYAGNDGGFWVTPLAERRSMPPPVLYGLNPEIGVEIVKINSQILAKSDNIDELHAYLMDIGINYVYIGARGGALSPHDMAASPNFKQIYNNEGTWIFQVITSN